MTAPNQNQQRWAAVEMAEKLARQKFTLIGPDVNRMPELYPDLVTRTDQYFAVRQCRRCDPPPKVYVCPICDWETTVKWHMQNHNMGGQSYLCRQRQRAKERAWSGNVGLDG